MRLEEEMLRASRNKVISRSEVGKTLNSTGRVIYIDTRSTITDRVILALYQDVEEEARHGHDHPRTIPKTARGTAKSEMPLKRDTGPSGFVKAEERREAVPRAFISGELAIKAAAADAPPTRVGAVGTT
ncbi:MAG TPA: hypothetical protein VEV85_04080 [Bryobacteraceae bacterium]|nr:hypothetical protein [Bryobacteraceae bacterium]